MKRTVAIFILLPLLTLSCIARVKPDKSQALLVASQFGDLREIKILLKKGENPNIQDEKGNTPLICFLNEEIAAQNKEQKQIDSGAQVDPGPEEMAGMTLQGIKLFLAHGANPLLKNKKRESAFTIIERDLHPNPNSIYRSNSRHLPLAFDSHYVAIYQEILARMRIAAVKFMKKQPVAKKHSKK